MQVHDNDPDDNTSWHELVIKNTAKLHGLFWLFFPGCGILAKMADYLNEWPVWFVGIKQRA